jgi:phenylpropionate dioxygenase-like ring-hydroxylating dioxygenase large terminal subunit
VTVTDASALASSLEQGATLPASWYTDPAIHRLEQERIFANAVRYAGPADRAPAGAVAWGPLAFQHADPETLGRLADTVAESGLDLAVLRHRQRVRWELRANWKVGIENYLECYHCSVAHPGFSKVIDVDPDAYVLRADGQVLSQFGPMRETARDGKAPYAPEGPVRQGQYHVLWPAVTLNVEPGPPNLSVDSWQPVAPDRTVGFTDYFFGADVPDAAAQEILDFSAQVGAEDDALVESVQRGLSSGMVPQGRLLPASEQLIRHFQRLVFEALAD